MGYTHYWTVNNLAKWQKIWPQLVKDAACIVKEAGVPLSLHIVTIESIELNSDEDHEDFILSTTVKHSWCKTDHKPYDVIVTAILIRASQLAGTAVNVTSDGSWEEWVPARKLIENVWPEDHVFCPWNEVTETQRQVLLSHTTLDFSSRYLARN